MQECTRIVTTNVGSCDRLNTLDFLFYAQHGSIRKGVEKGKVEKNKKKNHNYKTETNLHEVWAVLVTKEEKIKYSIFKNF